MTLVKENPLLQKTEEEDDSSLTSFVLLNKYRPKESCYPLISVPGGRVPWGVR